MTTPQEQQDPFYNFMCRHLSIREWELSLLKEEYAFLQTCGGVSPEDMVRFRASIAGYSTRTHVKREREEDEEEEEQQPPSQLVSLKSMLLEIITLSQTDNINRVCRHVRPLLDRDGIRTFCRHHATYVRSADLPRVRSVLEREGMAAVPAIVI